MAFYESYCGLILGLDMQSVHILSSCTVKLTVMDLQPVGYRKSVTVNLPYQMSKCFTIHIVAFVKLQVFNALSMETNPLNCQQDFSQHLEILAIPHRRCEQISILNDNNHFTPPTIKIQKVASQHILVLATYTNTNRDIEESWFPKIKKLFFR